MGNVSSNSNDKSVRDKVLKKAAMLATVASITGACAVGAQQPKESKALIGAIIGIITTVVGVGSGIASTVQSGVAQSEQERQARLQAEEEERARREAEEQERIRAALESAENNVRVAQQLSAESATEEAAKEIDISIANNDELMAKNASRVSIHTTGINRVSVPKDINVGGFGVSEDMEEDSSEIVDESQNESLTESEQVDLDIVDEVEEISNEDFNNNIGSLQSFNTESSNSGSNIVRFSMSDLEVEEGFGTVSDIVKDEVVAHGLGFVDGGYNSYDEEYVEIDESMLMSVEEAENHILVQEGYLTAEDVIVLDFGIRNGAIDEEVINTMYENGDINDDYYNGAMELMNEIYEEISQSQENE